MYTAAIKTNGTLWTCGYNGAGNLGDGTTINKSSPVQVGTSTDWKTVSCLDLTTIAIKTDGTLWVWGDGAVGTLGDGTNVSKCSPIQVGSKTNWTSIGTSSAGISAITLQSATIINGLPLQSGSVQLVDSVATVSTTLVDANSLIMLTSQINGGTPGLLSISARTVGTSFTISSSSITDTSTVAWYIINP